jgi:hypothetical protein
LTSVYLICIFRFAKLVSDQTGHHVLAFGNIHMECCSPGNSICNDIRSLYCYMIVNLFLCCWFGLKSLKYRIYIWDPCPVYLVGSNGKGLSTVFFAYIFAMYTYSAWFWVVVDCLSYDNRDELFYAKFMLIVKNAYMAILLSENSTIQRALESR